MQQRLIDIAKGAADRDVGGMAELFFAQDAVQVGQATTAEFGRHVHAIQTQGLGLLMEGLCFRIVQETVVFDLVFKTA